MLTKLTKGLCNRTCFKPPSQQQQPELPNEIVKQLKDWILKMTNSELEISSDEDIEIYPKHWIHFCTDSGDFDGKYQLTL